MPRRLEKACAVLSVISVPKKLAGRSQRQLRSDAGDACTVHGRPSPHLFHCHRLNHTDHLDRIGFGTLCPGKSGDLWDSVWPILANQARAKKPDIPDVNMDIEAVLEAIR